MHMAMALPVVTIDVPSLRRMVRPGVDGLLYPPGDVDAFAAAVARLLESPEESAGLGRAARAHVVDEFSWRVHFNRLEAILKSTV
jgi:glycosyltransferase involved in cell wall biosynthesis